MIVIHYKQKIHHKRAFLIALFGVVIIILFLSFFAINLNKEPPPQVLSVSEDKAASPTQEIESSPLLEKTDYGIPVRLEIPKIKVNARILQMGLTKDGDMEAPEKIQDAGWYKYGSQPGDMGTAVIDGHLGVGESGVFVDLDKLQKGDTILIIDDKGQTVSFVVREKRTYSRNERPTVVFESGDGTHLNLITCTGTWDKKLKGIPNRLVVFADKSS